MIPAEATVLPPALAGSRSVGGARRSPCRSRQPPQVALSRLTRILLLVAVALCLGAPTAGADAAKKLDNNLAALWTTILETPSAQNPFGTGGAAFACVDLGGTVAPFGPARRRVVHGKARHQDIRHGVLSRVQHVRGEWDD